MKSYTREFYQAHSDGAQRSAEVIVPLVLSLINPRTVIDIGCGLGTWLMIFEQFGIRDVFGIDGDHVENSMLKIAPERFLAVDLTQSIWMDRQFDLAISLEVAEHLPESCAQTFVESLTRLSPVILFSGAIPFQGGTGHVNEQWPEYWAKHFSAKGYEAIDCIRKKVWHNEKVEWWYAQNILLYCRRDYLAMAPSLREELVNAQPGPLSLVHPKKYLDLIQLQLTAQELSRLIPATESFILVDQDQLRETIGLGNQAVPFMEHNGQYWGPPADDETAIRELARLRRSGAKFLAFVWPAFWWLDYYKEFQDSLCSQYRCVLRNERLVVFELGDVNESSRPTSTS